MKFILNNETIQNAHGFFLLNGGGDFSRFKDNPVMLLGHNHNQLIGRWTDLKVEGDTLTAVPEYDEDDELAMKTKKKVDNKFLKGASPGVRILEMKYIDDKLFATKWELMEGSLVPVPSGKSSLAVYDNEGKQLSASEIKNHVNLYVKPKFEMKMKLVATILGLAAEASEEDVQKAVKALIDKNAQHTKDLSTKDEKIAELQGLVDAGKKEKIKNLVDAAIASKKIDETLRAFYEKSAETDFEGTEKALNAMQGVKKVTEQLGASETQIPEAEKNWTYKDYHKKGKLENLKATNLTRFKELYKAEFNREYKS